jgi:copper chaperone CopZ
MDRFRGLRQPMMKRTFHVDGMHCPNCAMQIEGVEDELDGIIGVRASYSKALVEIEYDESRVSPSQIFTKVKELGYTLTET